MNINLLAIDLAKNIFQLHGNDINGHCIYKKRVTRAKLPEIIANLSACTIVMESCGASNYWHRKFTAMGHTVKLIAPQYVKPFVKTNKNDMNDAEAIAEAASRPSMIFVPPKNIHQQDIQSIHRIRLRLVRTKTKLSNQMRGLLMEYGIFINQSYASLKEAIPGTLEDPNNELTTLTREFIQDVYDEFLLIEAKVKQYDLRIKSLAETDESSQKLLKIEGVGPIIATALTATMGDPLNFKNGRHFAAYLGLVPRQNSSGGKNVLLGISKRGDKYLRSMLIHGARSVVANAKNKQDPKSIWIMNKLARSNHNKTVIALANKIAKIAWAILAHDTEYDINHKLTT
jgi:transposase